MHPRNLLLALLVIALLGGLLVWRRNLGSARPEVAEQGPPIISAFPTDRPGLLQLVSDVRKLRFKSTPILTPVTAEELSRLQLEATQHDWPPEAAERRVRSFMALGFRWEPNYPLPEAIAGLTSDISGGFFETSSNRFYYDAALNFAERPDARNKWLAQAARVLLQQNFPTATQMRQTRESEDAWLARQTLVEGDVQRTVAQCLVLEPPATLVAVPSFPPPEPFYATPRFYRDYFLLPLTLGLPFIDSMLEGADPSSLDSLYATPPSSTSAILNAVASRPGTWRQSDVFIPSAPALGPAILEDTAGEAVILLLLKTQLRQEQAMAAASGWRGDRYRIFQGGQGGIDSVIWKSAWASHQDAQEFATALAAQVVNRYGLDAPPKSSDRNRFSIDSPARQLRAWVQPASSTVLAVITHDASLADSLAPK